MKNDPHTKFRNDAIKIRDRYHRIINKLRYKGLLENDDEARSQMLVEVVKYEKALREIGYRTTSESEPGMSGRVVAITPEWLKEEKGRIRKRKKYEKLLQEARANNNPTAYLEYIKKIILKRL